MSAENRTGQLSCAGVSSNQPSPGRTPFLVDNPRDIIDLPSVFCEEKNGESPNGLQTPRKQPPFLRGKRGYAERLLTPDFPCSMMTFLSCAPLAQMDRALDYELLVPTLASPRLFSVFSRLFYFPR